MNGRIRPRRRRGFTVIEMTIAGFLMVVLGLLLAQAWAAFGRPAISAIARARLAQEANLAAESLAHDVGLLSAPAGLQPDSRYQNVQPVGSTLYLTLDEGDGSARTISYAIDPDGSGRLLRTDSSGPRVVAMLISDFQAVRTTLPLGQGGSQVPGVQVDLTFRHRAYDRDRDGSFRGDFTRRYTLFVPDAQ